MNTWNTAAAAVLEVDMVVVMEEAVAALEVDLEEEEDMVDMTAVMAAVMEADMEVVVVDLVEEVEDMEAAGITTLGPVVMATVYRLVSVAGKCRIYFVPNKD